MAIALAPFVQPITSSLFGIFRIGHADDNVDAEEDRWLREFAIPVAGKAAGNSGPPFSWVETDRFIQAIDASRSPLPAKEAAAIITQGDQVEQELCSNFAQQGFPCGGKASYAGGAGRDVPRTWSLLRAKLTEIRDRQSLEGLPLTTPGAKILSLLTPGGGGGGAQVTTAGFLGAKTSIVLLLVGVVVSLFFLRR